MTDHIVSSQEAESGWPHWIHSQEAEMNLVLGSLSEFYLV